MNTQPMITAAAITSVVGAIIALLISFGVNLTGEQQAAIMGLVTVASPWIVALVGRSTTTPLADPKDEDGVPLTRAGTEEPTLKQQRSIGLE